MNKLILLILLICTSIMPLFAASNSGFYFKSGLTLSGLKLDDIDEERHHQMFVDEYKNLFTHNNSGYKPEGIIYTGAFIADHIFNALYAGMDIVDIEKFIAETDSVAPEFSTRYKSLFASFHPSFTIGYERSLNKAISANIGIGYRQGSQTFTVKKSRQFFGLLDKGIYTSLVKLPYVLFNRSVELYRNDFSYLVFPIDFKVMAPKKWGGVFLSVGPEISVLLSARRYFQHIENENGSSRDVPTSTDIRDDYKKVGVALGVRFGWEITAGNHAVLIETGFDGGFTNLSNTPNISIVKTRVITLIGLGFRFGRSNQNTVVEEETPITHTL